MKDLNFLIKQAFAFFQKEEKIGKKSKMSI